jgi:hypothetical protein
MLQPILIGLLGTSLSAPATTSGALSLDRTFKAYVRVITQDDEQAREALRTSLRTADPHVFPGIVDGVDTLYIHHAPGVEGKDPVAMAVIARWRAIRCEEIEHYRSEVVDRATISYRCSFPDVSSFFDIYREHPEHFQHPSDSQPAQAARRSFASALIQAPDGTYETSAEFFRAGKDGPWVSNDMMFLGLELLQKLLPFRAWSERIDAEAVSAHTGVAACDLMLEAHINAARRRVPHLSAPHDTSFQDTVQEAVGAMMPDRAAAHCRALHERHRERWNTDAGKAEPTLRVR